MLTAIRLMYSSLARAHSCAPLLYLYTNSVNIANKVSLLNTTMQTRTNIQAIVRKVSTIKRRGFEDTWRELSRHKLDVVTEHMARGERLVWMDLDTLVFVDLTPAFREDVAWAVGWSHGKSGVGSAAELAQIYSGVNVSPKLEVNGDLWLLNMDAINETIALETELKQNNATLPAYDLQGYFSILLTRNSTNFKVLQDIIPDYSYGFQCSSFSHPTATAFRPQVIDGELHCPDNQGVGLSSKVGSISFTSPTFRDVILRDPVNFSGISVPASREWLKQWFYNST